MKRNLILACAALTVFLAAYSVIFVYDRYFQAGRMWETPAVKPYENPILVMDDGVVPVLTGSENPQLVMTHLASRPLNEVEAVYRAADPLTLTSPLNPRDPEVLKRGKEAYFLYCYMCHGPDHDGQGTVGQSFAPLPGDLRSPKVQTMAVGQLFHEISYGIPGGRQPALATTMFPEDRWKVIHYVKSLGVRR
ncbi:MAG: cytochrome c [Desulfobacterales bacterium]|jgi:mono/diheme cytochrome c family protein